MENHQESLAVPSTFAQYLDWGCQNGLVWSELFMVLQKVSSPARQAEIIRLIEAYRKAPYAKKKIRNQLEKTMNFQEAYAPSAEEIMNMDLVDLYAVRKSILDQDYQGLSGRLRAIAENAGVKIKIIRTIAAIGRQIKKTANIQEATNVHAELAGQAIRDFSSQHGLDFQLDFNDCDLEELNARPHIFLFNHQGGGLETLMVASLFRDNDQPGRPNSIILKSDLKKIPVMRDILARMGSIYVERAKLSNPDTRKQEIEDISRQMSASLSDGRGLILFPEGTRSSDGSFAGSPARIKWAQDIGAAVNRTTELQPAPKVMVLLDTLLGFPSSIERPAEWLDSEARRTAGIKVRFFKLPDQIRFEDNPDNPFDQENFFGFARKNLAELQRAELAKLLKY